MTSSNLTARLHASEFLLRVVCRAADGELSFDSGRLPGPLEPTDNAPPAEPEIPYDRSADRRAATRQAASDPYDARSRG